MRLCIEVEVAIFVYCILIVDPSRGMPSNINVVYTSLKSTLVGYNSVADNMVLSLAVVAPPQICKILRKFKLLAVQGHSRSSILVQFENFLLVK